MRSRNWDCGVGGFDSQRPLGVAGKLFCGRGTFFPLWGRQGGNEMGAGVPPCGL